MARGVRDEHPADHAIMQEFLQVKTRFRNALAFYIEQVPDQANEN